MNVFYQNCSDQTKGIFDLILPHTTGDRTSGITMQTPKGLAKALVHRALAHPELPLRVRRYPQIPGTFGRSRGVLFPMENTYRNIAFAPYWYFGGFREVALSARLAVRRELQRPFEEFASDGTLSRQLLRSFEADGEFYVEPGGPWIRLPLGEGDWRATGLSRSQILDGDPRVATLVLAAVIDYHLHQSESRREDIACVDGLFTLLRLASGAIGRGTRDRADDEGGS